MTSFHIPSNNTRLGFHYFPDADHYRESDLQVWIPELHALGAKWLTLFAPSDRAIPEDFLRGLIEQGIEPILHLPFLDPTGRLASTPDLGALTTLFASYARWGVNYVVLFNRPNIRSTWPVSTWVQADLVERFLDRYLPIAQAAANTGLTPVFPPLEPGGDYWDTAFLRASLKAIERRSQNLLDHEIVLSAYARAGGYPLNWGNGGPERWPGARPYFSPPGTEDQRGFRTFDWYTKISEAVTGKTSPILLFQAGSYEKPSNSNSTTESQIDHTQRNLTIAQVMLGMIPSQGPISSPTKSQNKNNDQLDSISSNVLVCNFWLLAATPESYFINNAWFKLDGTTLPIVSLLRDLVKERVHNGQDVAAPRYFSTHSRSSTPPTFTLPSFLNKEPSQSSSKITSHPIPHYLLIPSYLWGVADWHLDVIRPFVKKLRPTIGFSLSEAVLAAHVTVVGGQEDFPERVIDDLRAAGCTVERIDGDGTSIATKLTR